jgi:Ni/Co efflux regulator RcnB
LPRAFWVRHWYITDYATYGVDPPPPDYQWIRYGPDLLLVNLDTGSIDQVQYGVFADEGDQQPDASGDDEDQGAPQ